MTTVGVISDTHGLLRPEAVSALAGVDLIVHAGDIGKPGVLDALSAIAPLKVIRGNIDKWAADLPDTELFAIDGRFIYVIHDIHDLDIDPAAAGIDVVISGHSHNPSIDHKDNVLYLNPGSAGPRRFSLPIVLATLVIGKGTVDAEIVDLV